MTLLIVASTSFLFSIVWDKISLMDFQINLESRSQKSFRFSPTFKTHIMVAPPANKLVNNEILYFLDF